MARYQRPSGSSGIANQMALDKVGNCYVLGNSSANGGVMVLIKYNSTGDTLWTRTYPAGNVGVISDSLGNVYVTSYIGPTFGPYDIVTIKYNSSGIQQWLKTYDSGSSDEPGDITMDRIGDVYIAGLSGNESIVIKYKPDGDTLWVRKFTQPNYRFPAFSIALDLQNNVCIGGNRIHTTNGGQEYFTIKYDSNGVFQWVQATSFNALTSLVKIKTDLNGNVIVTGKSLGGKIVTIKYNSSGSFQWQAQYTGPVSGTANPYDMKVDKQNNIIITGTSWGNGSFSDYVTLKYDNTNGDTLWVKRYNGTSNDDDIAYSLDLDDSDNVYITGRSINSGVSWDYVTIKYFSNGNQAWLATYNNQPTNAEDIAYVIRLDKSKNVYVTGSSRGFSGGPSDYLTIKYSQPLGIVNTNEFISQYTLEQNYPNPFNPVTNIKYQITKNSFVQLKVYDILGNEINALVNEKQNAGTYEVSFNAEKFSSGTYFYRLTVQNHSITKKMIVIK